MVGCPLGQLFGYRLNDRRMAMAVDQRGGIIEKIDSGVPIDIRNETSFPAFDING